MKANKKILLAAELALILSVASTPALAAIYPNATIRATGSVSPYGGDISLPHQSFDLSNNNANASSTPVGSSIGLLEGDGSYADATAYAGFGNLHAFSDAHRTYNDGYYTRGDAQSGSTAEFQDYLLAADNDPSIKFINYQLTLNLFGSHSSESLHNYPGYSAEAQVSWNIRNNANGDVLTSGVFDTSDTAPTLFKQISVSAAPNTLLSIEVSLSTFTYVISNDAAQYLTAFANYQDTLHVNLDAVTAGANTVGVSGYNYSTVPIPAALIFFLSGLGLFGLNKRTRRFA